MFRPSTSVAETKLPSNVKQAVEAKLIPLAEMVKIMELLSPSDVNFIESARNEALVERLQLTMGQKIAEQRIQAIKDFKWFNMTHTNQESSLRELTSNGLLSKDELKQIQSNDKKFSAAFTYRGAALLSGLLACHPDIIPMFIHSMSAKPVTTPTIR